MKTNIKLSFLFLLMFLLNVNFSLAQQENQTEDQEPYWQIETKDGNEFLGKIIYEDDQEIKLDTKNFGVLTIKKANIKTLKSVKIELIKEGEVWTDYPQGSRYFWAPNGYGLKKGEGYFQNVWIFFNQVSYGFTDNFTVGLGTVPVFLLGLGEVPVWITPKISIPIVKDKFNLGAGVLLGKMIGFESDWGDGTVGLLYGVSTFGSKNSNINIGLGYGFIDGELASRPTISLSGLHRVSKRGYILTENYIISSEGFSMGLLSFGGRTILKKVSLDYGGIIPVVSELGFIKIIIPWLGIVVPFDTKKPY
jgi:hypothetical protein